MHRTRSYSHNRGGSPQRPPMRFATATVAAEEAAQAAEAEEGMHASSTPRRMQQLQPQRHSQPTPLPRSHQRAAEAHSGDAHSSDQKQQEHAGDEIAHSEQPPLPLPLPPLPPNPTEIAARIRNRARAMQELRGVGPVRAMHAHPTPSSTAAAANSAAATSVPVASVASVTSVPPLQLPPSSYAHPFSTFKADVFALNLHPPSPRRRQAMQKQSSRPSTPTSLRRSSTNTPSRRQSQPSSPSSEGMLARRKEIAAQTRQYAQYHKQQQHQAGAAENNDEDMMPPELPSLPPLQIAYEPQATRLTLPEVDESLTPQAVLDWFRRTLHIDLAPSLPHDSMDSDAAPKADETPPPMSPDSPWWSSLCERFRDGVLLGRISSALNAEPLPGLQLHPRNHASVLRNWTIALEQLRVGGGLNPSARAPSRIPSSPRSTPLPSSRGDGTIPFVWLFHPEDLLSCEQNPLVLFRLLAKTRMEYATIPPRGYSVELVEDPRMHQGSTRSFVGENNLYVKPMPTPRSASRGRSASRSPTRSNTPQRPHSRPSTPRRDGSATDRPASAAQRLSSAAAASRRSPPNSARGLGAARPPSPAVHLTRRASFDASTSSARSSSPLRPESLAELQDFSLRIAKVAAAQEIEALSRPRIFQPKSHMRAIYARQGAGADDEESFDSLRQQRQTRPDQAGLFFDTHARATPASKVDSMSPSLASSSSSSWEAWPPLQVVVPTQEKILRSWLAQELGVVVLPSQENNTSPLGDPYRNGTVICEVAKRFFKRFAVDQGLENESIIPVKRRPAVLDAALENTIRGLLGIRRALRLRHALRQRRGDATAMESLLEREREPPFATMLLTLPPRLEQVVDQLIKGDNQTLWGLMWYLYTEWNLADDATEAAHEEQKEATSDLSPATSRNNNDNNSNNGWSEVELALLTWMQSLGVGVGLGALDEDSPLMDLDPNLARASTSESKEEEEDPHNQHHHHHAHKVFPPAAQLGITHFLTLMRKGVLLCDLVLATAPPSPSGASGAKLTNIVRDPRTWTLCRQNIRKALTALSPRPRLSMHLLRTNFDSTVDAIADGDRRTCFQLLYDIYAQFVGLPPHHSARECMGRQTVDNNSRSVANKRSAPVHAWGDLQHALSTPRRSKPSPQPGSVRRLSSAEASYADRISSESALRRLEREEALAEEAAMLMPHSELAGEAAVAPPLNPSSTSSLSAQSSSSATRASKLVHESLQLFDWLSSFGLRALNNSVTSPAVFLSARELEGLSAEQREKVGAPAAGAAAVKDDGGSPSPSVFSDGLLLCTLVSTLTHESLPVVSPSSRRPGVVVSAPALRATSLHNIELAFGALQRVQRMSMQWLYREAAHMIRQGDMVATRGLLHDIRAAFPASHRMQHQANMPVQAFATLRRARGSLR